MAEKRKISFSITFRIENKKILIEAFHKSKWDSKFNINILHYRFRINGRWLDITHHTKKFMCLHELKNLFMKDLNKLLIDENEVFWIGLMR